MERVSHRLESRNSRHIRPWPSAGGTCEMRSLQNTALVFALLVLVRPAPAQLNRHPAIPKEADCSSCHGLKTTGKSVHSAIELGCGACHDVATDGKNTTVDLKMPKTQLCFACHQKSGEEYLHSPYAQGNCTSCHDAHSSDYPVHLRAESNSVCLRCHAPQRFRNSTAATSEAQPGGPAAKDVPAGGAPFETVSAATFESALRAIHGSAESFSRMMSAIQSAHQPVLCATCHDPHSSPRSKLISNLAAPGL
jgi:predicted CXXCH cytochrome family protein